MQEAIEENYYLQQVFLRCEGRIIAEADLLGIMKKDDCLREFTILAVHFATARKATG